MLEYRQGAGSPCQTTLFQTTPRPRNPLDQPALGHPGGQRAEGLVGLEGQHREVVQRGVRLAVQVAQGVPLHEGEPERRQGAVQRAVMTILQALDSQGDAGGAQSNW